MQTEKEQTNNIGIYHNTQKIFAFFLHVMEKSVEYHAQHEDMLKETSHIALPESTCRSLGN